MRHVVDGQQPLTTLQLLLDAAQSVVTKHGAPMDAQALRVLILNDAAIAQHPDQVYKVWPTDRDQDAFRAAMDDDSEVTAVLAETRIAQAHAFFVTKITDWAIVENDPAATARRLGSLVRALRDHLKLVVIDLDPGDNAQVIFETLNHRGSRLLAADLVKNFLFQIAESQHADVTALYRAHWRDLDNDYWRHKLPYDSVSGRFYYRIVRAMDSGVVSPPLLWMLRWDEQRMPPRSSRRRSWRWRAGSSGVRCAGRR